jgi:hypothetical protein
MGSLNGFIERLRLKHLILVTAILWIGSLILILFVWPVIDPDAPNGTLRGVASFMVSFPPISLIISLLIGGQVSRSRKPERIFIIPLVWYLINIFVIIIAGAYLIRWLMGT